MAATPTVYLLHGDNELAIQAVVQELFSRLGDPTNAEMNTARFEGPHISFDELKGAATAMPFLAERRLVVLREAGKAFNAQEARERFLGLLDEVPASTALVLHESPLKASHWLMKWAKGAGERAYIKNFELPKGSQMAGWIQKQVGAQGGAIEGPAAALLAEQIGSDTRAASHEIDKLLAHANYARAITREDVAELAVQVGEQGDFFALIDALSAGAGKQAMQALHKLLAERDLISLFFGIVAHYRALIQAWEINQTGGGTEAMKKAIGTGSDFRANKLLTQARRFDIVSLKAIYQRLMEYDRQIKTGELDAELALDSFVAALTAQTA